MDASCIRGCSGKSPFQFLSVIKVHVNLILLDWPREERERKITSKLETNSSE